MSGVSSYCGDRSLVDYINPADDPRKKCAARATAEVVSPANSDLDTGSFATGLSQRQVRAWSAMPPKAALGLR